MDYARAFDLKVKSCSKYVVAREKRKTEQKMQQTMILSPDCFRQLFPLIFYACFSTVRTANVAGLKKNTRKKPAPHYDSIKNSEKVVLQTQVAYARSGKISKSRMYPSTRSAAPHSPPSAKPKGVSNEWLSKWQGKKKDFFKIGVLVPVCFGTSLGVSLAAPKGVSRRMCIKMASFLSFENLTFWYPFVLVPIWLPPTP